MAYQNFSDGQVLYAGSLNNNFNYVNGLRYAVTNMEIPVSGTVGYIGSYLFNGGGSEFLGNTGIINIEMINDNVGGSLIVGFSGNNFLFSGAPTKLTSIQWIHSKMWIGSSTSFPIAYINVTSEEREGTRRAAGLYSVGSPYNLTNPFCAMWYIKNFTGTGSIFYKIYNSPN